MGIPAIPRRNPYIVSNGDTKRPLLFIAAEE
jgi:hypothetical protein